ncbi:hypothetical protein [Bradyrhizobium sp. USDA 3364]
MNMTLILTPDGYKSPVALANGDDVCAFDLSTGTPIVNAIENIEPVDYAEWCRWWQVEDEVPPFTWYRINGSLLLFREQSVWRNGINVCHARDLVVGDEIYDDADNAVRIASVEPVEDHSLIWYRFDISGDHSYIVDGLTVHNASRFWVGGTGTWDSSTTTNWAASSNGTGGQSVPGSADFVTFDALSGGGTVTLNFGGTITLQAIAMGAFTGTWDNSVNNNNVTCSNTSQTFNISGSGARTIKLGSATYTINGNGVWNAGTTTNLTFIGSSATIVFAGNGARTLTGGGLTYGTISVSAGTSGGGLTISGANTIGTLSVSPPNYISLPTSGTNTITAMNCAGTSSSQILIQPSSVGSAASLTHSGSIGTYCALVGISCTGSPTASNSFDCGGNSGITITAPSPGGNLYGMVG